MRFQWMTATALLVSLNAFAQSPLEQQISACTQYSDKLERLICFDKVAQSITSSQAGSVAVQSPSVNSNQPVQVASPQVAASQAVPTTQVTSPQVAVATSQTKTVAQQQAEFGLKQAPVEAKVEKLYATVTESKKDQYGAFIVTLDNGQVWKQIESRRYKVKQGETVYIEAAALGSFILGTDKRNTTIRVKRIK
ncbi:hypothetical protein [Shewanella maritima]|uniref:hypothetical protein n=1 Tax=Shewanella maritima TaxID=2520507 RepID=UPI003735E883